jgi:hypothetical protein
MRRSKRQKTIKLDQNVDRLLELVAQAKDDDFDPRLLEEVIPDKQMFLEYLKHNRLMDDPAAKSILAKLGLNVAEQTVENEIQEIGG